MPLPKKYHAITFMSILVMLLLLGIYLLSGGYTAATESQTAESRTAALARANSTTNNQRNLQLPSSSNTLPAYRHPIVYDKLTGATNNQINDVLGAGKQATFLSDYPIDHYQQQQQQQQQQQPMQQPYPYHPGQNLLADAQQQQRHRQQMLDRQMLFGANSDPFGGRPGPPLPLDFGANQTSNNYYPDPALFRQQQQQPLPMMPPPFPLPPPPPPPQSQQPPSQQQQQQQSPITSTSNQTPIRPPYAHLAPMNMPPMSQYEQQQSPLPLHQHQQHLKPAAQSRIIPLNSRIDPNINVIQPSSQHQPLQPPPQQQQQMVLASNQAPPKTSNSALPLQTLSNVPGSKLAASSSSSAAAAAAAPLCVRQQIDQLQQQQVPSTANNETVSSGGGGAVTRVQMPVLFCNIDPEYPTKEIMRALEIYAQEQRTIEHLMPQLLIQLHIQAQPARQPGGNHQLLTLDQLQSSLVSQPTNSNRENGSSVSNQYLAEKQFPSVNFEQMCRSTIQMAQPRRAKNLAGQWKIVVNLPGHKYRGIAISQMVRVEECSAPLGECATPSKPSVGLAKSSCLQHYENQRLISWSPQQGLHLDMFRMPVACSCHIRRP